MKAKDLQGSKYTLLTDSQDLDALCDYYPIIDRDLITGAIVAVEDGDYSEVYITESDKPYEIYADYMSLEDYSDMLKESLGRTIS